MNANKFLALAATLFIAVGAGCHKSEPPPTSQVINGTTVDMPRLQKALEANTNPDVRNQITQVAFGVRYGYYPKALMALDQLSTNPNVSDTEKKVVNEVIEQVKKLAENAPAPAQ